VKSQTVRLVDVFALGPFMVWAAAKATGLPPWARATLSLAGLATVLYNGRNYRAAHARRSSRGEVGPYMRGRG